MIINDVEAHRIESREQWLRLRKQDITASDIGAIVGVHPYSSPLQVWADKMDLTTVEENNAMRRGRWLEDGVLSALREEYPTWKISKPGAYLRSPSLRIGATPDAFAITPEGHRIIQCKVVAKTIFERDWVDGPPLYYQLQTLTEAKLSDMPLASLAALVVSEFGADLELFDVPINEAAFDRCARSVREFWEMIAVGKKPAADYTKDGEAISKIYRANRGEADPVDLSHDNRMLELVAKYQRDGSAIKGLEEERKATKAEMVEKLGGARKAIVGTWKVSNTPVDVKAHEVRASSYDRLTVTAPKK